MQGIGRVGTLSITCGMLMLSLVGVLYLPSIAAATVEIKDVTSVGNTVVIRGADFDTVAHRNCVTIDGKAANVTSATTTLLIVDIPNDVKPSPIVVANAHGTATTTKIYDFTGTNIKKVTPLRARVGAPVFIEGSKFDLVPANNAVFFGTTLVGGHEVLAGNESLLVVTVPSGAETGRITVKNNSSGGMAISPSDFTVDARPTITRLEPVAAFVGEKITIDGSHFDAVAGDNEVYFNDKVKVKAITASPTRLEVNVPNQAESVKVAVSTLSGGKGEVSAQKLTVLNVIKFNPSSGVKGGKVIIYGKDAATHDVMFTGSSIKAKKWAAKKGDPKVVVTVPEDAESGPICLKASAGEEVGRSIGRFEVRGAENAVHLFGGGTVNFYKKGEDGSTADLQPHVGLMGVHKIPATAICTPLKPGGHFLLGAEIIYRGVAADQALVANNRNGVNLEGLASAKAVGLFGNTYYSMGILDTFSVGPGGFIGYEFLTGDKYKGDAQYSNGIGVRIQDTGSPLYYGQIAYGNTEYLSHNRLLIDISLPLLSSVLGKDTDFYHPDFTDFFFFINANIGLSHAKDDQFLFGIKGVLSANRLLKFFNPGYIFADKDAVTTAPAQSATAVSK